MLNEKYRIIRLLGQGGSGSVYLAEHINIGNRWAVKEVSLDTQGINELLTEIEILKRLNHRSLPRIVDMVERDGHLYIIEDYFDGCSLKLLLENRELCSEENVLGWARQLCEILIYLHGFKPNPIIYRDLKPGNIIISVDNEVKLVDLGIAREYKLDQQGDTTYIGTRGYAAPEQYYGLIQSDVRTDIYGMGATMYHALTGLNPNAPPYQMQPLRTVNKSLSRGVERLITKCTNKDPEKRYQNAEELLEDINSLDKNSADTNRHGSGVTRYTSAASKLIVVGSLSPRAGSSFITANLAAAVADKNILTGVLELPVNIPYYHDALVMREKAAAGYRSSDKLKGLVFAHTKQGADAITWAVSDPAQWSKRDWSFDEVLNVAYLLKTNPVVLVDVSNNWGHPCVKPLLSFADLAFLVVEPDPVILDRSGHPGETRARWGDTDLMQELQTIQFLTETEAENPGLVKVIMNKYAGFVDVRALSLPFELMASVPYMDPYEVNKALWEGTILYGSPGAKEIFDCVFEQVLDAILPSDMPEHQEKPKRWLAEKVQMLQRVLGRKREGLL